MRLVAWLMVLLMVGGCKKTDKPTPSPVCGSYLACLSAASPQDYASALSTYGPDGQCWSSESMTAGCEAACREGLAVLAAANPQRAECKSTSLNDGGGGDAPRPVLDFGPLPTAVEVDILFMIDNSNSMEPKQQILSASFPQLIESLRNPKLGGPGCSASNRASCKIPNVRIGVVTSDLGAGNYSLPSCEVAGGDGGKLQNKARKAGCVPPKDPWISYNDGLTNIPSSTLDPVTQVKEAFSCIAELGVGGCGFEHQLESARRALDPVKNVNPGFLRPNAYLAIVIVTDEDDCSAKKPSLFDPSATDPLGPLLAYRCTEFGIQCDEKTPREPGTKHNCVPGFDWLQSVDEYATFFRGLKAPGRVFMLAIAGPATVGGNIDIGLEGSNPYLKASCQSVSGSGVPAIRIASVVKSFGPQRGFFNADSLDSSGICSSDFGLALRRLGERITVTGP